jgi:hypothetical protein
MPAFAAFSINDGAASPASHTFSPISAENGLFVWQEQVGGIPLLYKTVWFKRTRASAAGAGTKSSADRSDKVEVSISIPTPETLGTNDAGYTPPPTIACMDRYNGKFVQPERSTEATRKDVQAFASNLYAHATFKAAIAQQQGFTGA